MIATHPQPATARAERARADSARTPSAVSPAAPSGKGAGLEDLRHEIDRVDGRILRLIARRVGLAAQAGACKRAAGAAVQDPAREASVVRGAAARARRAGLDEEIVRGVFWDLVRLCRDAQQTAGPGRDG